MAHKILKLCRQALPLCALLAQTAFAQLAFHSQRTSPTDLEITGLQPQAVFLSLAQIAALPQVSAHPIDDDDFSKGVPITVRGVELTTLLAAIHAPSSLDLVDLRCRDGYRSHLTHTFLAQHHPILGFTVNNTTPDAWSASAHAYNPGPYFLAYAHFKPSFRVLAHDDYAQVPGNVLELHLSTERASFASITPPPAFAHNTQVQQGFTIVKQNCLRCHSSGPIGGTKSRFTFADLTQIAHDVPRVFAAYTRNPKALNPEARMPPNPAYDDATIAAIAAYFTSFPNTLSTKDARR